MQGALARVLRRPRSLRLAAGLSGVTLLAGAAFVSLPAPAQDSRFAAPTATDAQPRPEDQPVATSPVDVLNPCDRTVVPPPGADGTTCMLPFPSNLYTTGTGEDRRLNLPLAGMPKNAYGDHQVERQRRGGRPQRWCRRRPDAARGRPLSRRRSAVRVPQIAAYPYRGSALVYSGTGDFTAANPNGTPSPPTTNTPPKLGKDPHEATRRSACGRVLNSDFLRLDSFVGQPCLGAPYFAFDYKGRRAAGPGRHGAGRRCGPARGRAAAAGGAGHPGARRRRRRAARTRRTTRTRAERGPWPWWDEAGRSRNGLTVGAARPSLAAGRASGGDA